MRSTNSKDRFPVIIVSGFLGSGKTTFIQKLVSPTIDRINTVILENEFGDVNFDGAALKKRGLSVVSVVAGCICCTGVGDFTGSIQEAAEQFAPQLLVIEPTGVAKLSDILSLFKIPPLLNICKVKQSITVVDAKNFEKMHFLAEEFYENQLMSSDVAYLSKTEELSRDVIDDVIARVHEIAPSVLIVDRPWELLTDDERETAQSYRKELAVCEHCGHVHDEDDDCGHDHHHDDHDHHDHHAHGHDDHDHEHDHHDHDHHHGHDHDHSGHDHDHRTHAFTACSFTPACSSEHFQENSRELSGRRFGTVLRVKGFLRSAGGDWMQIDYVPGELRVTEVKDEAPEVGSRLVFIGASLKEQNIAKFLGN